MANNTGTGIRRNEDWLNKGESSLEQQLLIKVIVEMAAELGCLTSGELDMRGELFSLVRAK